MIFKTDYLQCFYFRQEKKESRGANYVCFSLSSLMDRDDTESARCVALCSFVKYSVKRCFNHYATPATNVRVFVVCSLPQKLQFFNIAERNSGLKITKKWRQELCKLIRDQGGSHRNSR